MLSQLSTMTGDILHSWHCQTPCAFLGQNEAGGELVNLKLLDDSRYLLYSKLGEDFVSTRTSMY